MFLFKLKMFPRRLVRKKLTDMAGNTTNEYRWVISRAWTLFGIRLMWKQQDAYLRFGYDQYDKCRLRWVDWIYIDSTCFFQSEATAQNFIRDIIDNPSKYYSDKDYQAWAASSAMSAADLTQFFKKICNLVKNQ